MNALKLIPIGFKTFSPLFPSLTGQLALELFCRPRRLKRPEQEVEFWKTGTDFPLASGRHAKIWGEGPRIWLVHGWESRGSTFYRLIPELVKAGFEVVGWDGPAHGSSPGEVTTGPEIARALGEDIQSTSKEIVALVGHSIGGAAIGILSQEAKVPQKLVIVAAPTSIPEVFDRFTQQVQLQKRASQKLRYFAEKRVKISLEKASLLYMPDALHRDTLVIHDEHDKEIPFDNFTRLQEKWPSAQFISTQRLGHRRITKDSKVIQSIVDFLSPLASS